MARNFYGEPLVPLLRGKDEPASATYYLLSRERSNGTAHWWKPNHNGYTSDLNEAGLYCEAEALAIQSNGGSIAYRSDTVNKLLAVRRIVDMTDPINVAFFAELVDVPG